MPLPCGALLESFVKLDSRTVAKKPVMFVVEVGGVLTTYYWNRELVTQTGDLRFTGQVTLWLIDKDLVLRRLA